MILEARGLTIGYGDRVVGSDISVTLRAGEVLALLGPNGGGKTTLLKTLLGLIPARAGHIRIDSQPLPAISVRQRARLIAYVPQVHTGTFAFSVDEIVLMGRTAHRGLFAAPTAHDRAVARAMIERTGLAGLASRPYTMISGGERQLGLVARALAQEPRIVFLDEPTASLDFGNQGRIMREIRCLASDGIAVLFTTHDPNQARRFADRAMLLRGGRSVAVGPVSEIITRENLDALYQAPIETVADSTSGSVAFLPG
jgi:iron complex transport system ATP-binding protein